MTLPVYPNSISVSQIRTEFGLSGNSSLSQLYLNPGNGPVHRGVYGYPGGGSAKEPPSSGIISLSDFHGATKYVPIPRTVTLYAGSGVWTVPSTLYGQLEIVVIGGGGGGCHWPSGAAGGAGGGGAWWRGDIPRGTAISYNVGRGGPSVYHDSTRYARDANDTSFGTSGQSWYMYVPGLGTGGYNMSGSRRGPGVGSTGQGGTTSGTGGNGMPERTSGRAGDALRYGGGGGACDRADSTGGYGAGGGANGGNRYQNGNWPGGGGSGNNSASPTPWTTTGGDGAVFISGTW